jgi:hypothetical protein
MHKKKTVFVGKVEVNKIVSFSEMYVIFVVILLIFAGCCKTIRCTMAW